MHMATRDQYEIRQESRTAKYESVAMSQCRNTNTDNADRYDHIHDHMIT